MGIQINGNTNNINAGIGSLSIEDINELDIVGVATAANFKTGVSNLHDVGLTLSGGQIDVGSNIKIGTAGVITATSFVGSGANLTGITGTTINNNANNRLITGSGTANTLEGESNLTFDGTNISVGTGATISTAGNVTAGIATFAGGVTFKGDNGTLHWRMKPSGNFEPSFNNFFSIGDTSYNVNNVYTKNLVLSEDIIHNLDTNTKIRFPSNDTISFETAGSQRLRIYDDGYVIIGSTSKSGTTGAGGLDIQGNSTNCILEMGNPFPSFSGGVVPEFRITATNSSHTVDFESVWGGDNLLHKHLAFSGGATMIYQGTSNTEVARFTGEGLVVGSTTFSNAHNTDPGACVFENGQVMCRRDNTMFTAKSISTGGQNAFRVLSAQTQVGSIYFNSGGTSFNTSSDYRRKENVIDLTGAITRLKTLKPKRFNFISNPAVTLDGFLAHEVTAVPEAVTGTKDEVATEDGEDYKKGDPIYQQLDQSKLVPLLVAALQEAVARIEALEGS